VFVTILFGTCLPIFYINIDLIHKTVTLALVLCGCKTSSLTPREEHRLRMYEHRMLRRIFGLKREEVAGDWRSLHNKELHNLYTSLNNIGMIKLRRMRWVRQVAYVGEMRNAYKIFGRKT
jgi:hypothetical protein